MLSFVALSSASTAPFPDPLLATLPFGALQSSTLCGATSRVTALRGAAPHVAQQRDCLFSPDNHNIDPNGGPVMDVVNPWHNSKTRSSPRLRSPVRVPDAKAYAFDQVVHGPAVTQHISCGEDNPLLLSLGKKHWHIVEVATAEDTIGMGLVLAVLRAPLPRIYDSRVWCVIWRSVHQRPHYTTNTTATLLGQEQLMIVAVFIPLFWISQRCATVRRQSHHLNNGVACCNSERVGNND